MVKARVVVMTAPSLCTAVTRVVQSVDCASIKILGAVGVVSEQQHVHLREGFLHAASTRASSTVFFAEQACVVHGH